MAARGLSDSAHVKRPGADAGANQATAVAARGALSIGAQNSALGSTSESQGT
jgi:hypothetical protein